MLSTVLEDNHENKDDNQSASFPRLFLMTIYLYEKEAKYMPFVSKKSKKMLLESLLVLLKIAFVQITRGQEAERKPGEDPSHKKCQTSF